MQDTPYRKPRSAMAVWVGKNRLLLQVTNTRLTKVLEPPWQICWRRVCTPSVLKHEALTPTCNAECIEARSSDPYLQRWVYWTMKLWPLSAMKVGRLKSCPTRSQCWRPHCNEPSAIWRMLCYVVQLQMCKSGFEPEDQWQASTHGLKQSTAVLCQGVF